ncbi:MAG: HEAT repeat domain-containing protein [Planctomycetes bacterium]|nr:HEAT repeat domain-containing protein [Planctomycetota bacterium]
MIKLFIRHWFLVFFLCVLCVSVVNSDTETKLPDYFKKYADEAVKRLGAEDWQARESAMDELIMLGPAVMPLVQKEMDNSDPEIKLRARHVNLALRWKAAFAQRIDKFITQVRKGTIDDMELLMQSLQFLRGDESVYILIDLLKDSKQTQQSRQKIVQAFQGTGANLKPVLDDLIQLWKNETDPSIRYALMLSFARAGKDERLTTLLSDAVKSEDYNTKIGAISVIGQIKEETLVPELFKLLQATDLNTRNSAIYALNSFRTPQTFEAIFNAWKTWNTPAEAWLKNQTINILAQYQDKRLLAELLEMSKTEKDPQRLTAVVSTLYQFRSDPAVSPVLLNLFRTGDANVRATAFNILKANNDRSVIPDLLKQLEAENDFTSFTTQLGVLQDFTAQRFMPQQIPPELKASIIKAVKEWMEKNK